MTNDVSISETYRPWLHRYALLLTAVTFPLIASGGTVTSAGVGMVDPTWTFAPFKLFTSEGLQELVNVGMMIEHSHRQIGWIVGMMAIALAVWIAVTQQGLARKLLGLWVLLAVGSQGLLGAARIWSHTKAGLISPDLGRDIAMLHGVTGQLVLCLMALTAALLAPCGVTTHIRTIPGASRFQRIALWTTLLMVIQLVIGVLLRHLGGQIYLWLHVFFGAAVAAHVILVFVRSRQMEGVGRGLGTILLSLLLLQVLLGVAAWWFGGGSGMMYFTEKLTNERIVLTTVHQFTGALLLMTSAVTTFRAFRHLREETQPAEVGV
jgi:heme a synthase